METANSLRRRPLRTPPQRAIGPNEEHPSGRKVRTLELKRPKASVKCPPGARSLKREARRLRGSLERRPLMPSRDEVISCLPAGIIAHLASLFRAATSCGQTACLLAFALASRRARRARRTSTTKTQTKAAAMASANIAKSASMTGSQVTAPGLVSCPHFRPSRPPCRRQFHWHEASPWSWLRQPRRCPRR